MSGWKISPSGVSGVLTKVDGSAEKLGAEFTGVGSDMQPLAAAFGSQGGCLLGDVAEAISGVMASESTRATAVGKRIEACGLGAAQATTEYGHGQETMASSTQSKAVAAASSGDLSFYTGPKK